MEHFRNERARHMICKRNHTLDGGRLDFSAPITSSLIHQLVMCLTSADKCRTLCQMCAPMLESELHELNCLSVQKTHQIEMLLPPLFQLKPSFASAIFDRQVLKQCSGRIWMCSTPQSVDTHSEPDRHFVSAKPRSVIPSKMTQTIASAMRMQKKLSK